MGYKRTKTHLVAGIKPGPRMIVLFVCCPDKSWTVRKKQVEIVLEEIQSVFILNDLSGTATDVKKKKIETLEKFFGTCSWAAIESKSLEELTTCLNNLKNYFQKSTQEPNLKVVNE